jgi:hypothetical protein
MEHNDFKTDYNNLMKMEDILIKYNISRTSYFTILKQLNLKRIISTKTSRLLGYSITNNKPKEPIEIKKIDEIKPIITKKAPILAVETIQLNKIDTIPIIKKKKKIKQNNTAELEDIFKEAELSNIRFNNHIKNKKPPINKDV